MPTAHLNRFSCSNPWASIIIERDPGLCDGGLQERTWWTERRRWIPKGTLLGVSMANTDVTSCSQINLLQLNRAAWAKAVLSSDIADLLPEWGSSELEFRFTREVFQVTACSAFRVVAMFPPYLEHLTKPWSSLPFMFTLPVASEGVVKLAEQDYQ